MIGRCDRRVKNLRRASGGLEDHEPSDGQTHDLIDVRTKSWCYNSADRKAVSSRVEQASPVRRDGSRTWCGDGFGAKRGY